MWNTRVLPPPLNHPADYHSVPGSGGRLLHLDPRRTQRSLAQVPAKCCAIPPSSPPSFPSSRCMFTFSRSRSSEAGSGNQPDVGVWRLFASSINTPPPPPPPTSLPPSLSRVPSSISLNFQLDVSEMLINSTQGGDDIADKRRLFHDGTAREQFRSRPSTFHHPTVLTSPFRCRKVADVGAGGGNGSRDGGDPEVSRATAAARTGGSTAGPCGVQPGEREGRGGVWGGGGGGGLGNQMIL